MRDVKGVVKGHGSGSLEIRFAFLYCIQERIKTIRSSKEMELGDPWFPAKGFTRDAEETSEIQHWMGPNGVRFLDNGFDVSPVADANIYDQCRLALKTFGELLDTSNTESEWRLVKPPAIGEENENNIRYLPTSSCTIRNKNRLRVIGYCIYMVSMHILLYDVSGYRLRAQIIRHRYHIYPRMKKGPGTSEVLSSMMYNRFRTRVNHWVKVTYPWANTCNCSSGEAWNDTEGRRKCRESWFLPSQDWGGEDIPNNRRGYCFKYIV